MSSSAVLLFLTLMAVSGILLNHREALSGCEVTRSLLPPFYRFHDWNGGLMRGSIAFRGSSGEEKVALYGNEGVWLTDRSGVSFSDFNRGIPSPAAFRNVRAMTQLPGGELFLATTDRLYRLGASGGEWMPVDMRLGGEEPVSDMTNRGDSLIVLTRSAVYVAQKPWREFRRMQLGSPEGTAQEKQTLFRPVWKLHSGQLFGTPGILAADFIGLVFIFLCLTGVLLLLFPSLIRRSRNPKLRKRIAGMMGWTLRNHRKAGFYTFFFTLLICVTGWLLRPPGLIALVNISVPAVGKTNPWEDELRMIRYDVPRGRWLISTSGGFYETDASLQGKMRRLPVQPPVSVMGLNVWEKENEDVWICGSFSGIYRWNMKSGAITDYESGKPADLKPGPPFGKTAAAGYSGDFRCGSVVATYDKGTSILLQPDSLSTLPMPLWNVALETHTGRIFFGNSATYFFIFIVGGISFWSLLSGFMCARRRKKNVSS